MVFIVSSILLFVVELVSFSLIRSNYPFGMTIAGIPVGGLSPSETTQRLLQIYSSPIEIHYSNSVIQLEPSLVGFSINIESMLAAADLQKSKSSFWIGFWNFLWSRQTTSTDIPLISSQSDKLVQDYLINEISIRYDKEPSPAQLIPGTTDFSPGASGEKIDIDRSLTLISSSLKSPINRTVILPKININSTKPSLANLQFLLKQIISDNKFDGIIGIYLLDLQTSEELHFAYNNYESISINPDIAFSASSTIKIPIMISIYKEFSGLLDNATIKLVDEMIAQSENPAADSLMEILDSANGPVIVTEDLKTLGLRNTFIAGYFYNNAPNLLPYYSTPANSRLDVSTDPDWYSQTTPSDMGMLLSDIYYCSKTEGGALLAAFPGTINKQSCQQMVNYLKSDRIGLLIEAGVPDGTSVAHKHGWVLDVNTGVYHDISDAGIIFSPGGDYILSIYAYHPIQVIWEYPESRIGASRMFADISRVIYNYFNLP